MNEILKPADVIDFSKKLTRFIRESRSKYSDDVMQDCFFHAYFSMNNAAADTGALGSGANAAGQQGRMSMQMGANSAAMMQDAAKANAQGSTSEQSGKDSGIMKVLSGVKLPKLCSDEKEHMDWLLKGKKHWCNYISYCLIHESSDCNKATEQSLKLELGKVYEDECGFRLLAYKIIESAFRCIFLDGKRVEIYNVNGKSWSYGRGNIIKLSPDQRPYHVHVKEEDEDIC